MRKFERARGFTLVEILLTSVIIGVLLAIIVPRAWRANVDTKYQLVRQAGTELAGYAQQWAHEELLNQDRDSAGMPQLVSGFPVRLDQRHLYQQNRVAAQCQRQLGRAQPSRSRAQYSPIGVVPVMPIFRPPGCLP